jgi:hypothetical protein
MSRSSPSQPITQNTIIPCPEYHLQFYICSYLFFTNIYIYTYTHLTLPSQLLTLNKKQGTLLFFTPFYLRHAARSPVHRMSLRHTVPEFIDPVFAKTSQNARFLLSENERFGLVFVKTGSINSGTGCGITVLLLCM